MTEDLLRRLELLEGQALALAQTVADLRAACSALPTTACPHPEAEQRDVTTMGGPRRTLCRQCMTILETRRPDPSIEPPAFVMINKGYTPGTPNPGGVGEPRAEI